MTRRRQTAPRADAARNVERILEAGRIALRERGPSVPFYEIAKSAGVGQATLYRHFPNKQALVRAIVEENTSALETAAAQLDDADQPFEQVLEVLGGLIAESGEISALMAEEVGSDWYARLMGRLVDILEEVLEREQTRGVLRSDLDRSDLAMVLHMLGGAVTAETVAERQKQSRRAVRILHDGMLGREDVNR